MKPRVVAHVHGGAVVVDSNVGELDRCHHAPVVEALAKSLGLDLVPMAKAATDGEGEDPRYPELWTLARAARDEWWRYGRRLVEIVESLIREGRLFPMTRENEAFLQALLEEHATGVVIRLTGRGTPADVARLVDRGIVAPDVENTNWITASFAAGMRLDQLKLHQEGRPAPPIAEILASTARDVPAFTPKERAALDYVQRHGAVFMRRPAEAAVSEAARILNEAEYEAVRGALGEGVRKRWSATRVARELRDAVEGTNLTNDMDRVARTEMVYAHNHGAAVALEAQAARAGIKDPNVYKSVAPRACHHCRRIWGPPGKPKVYKLSFVKEREAAGGNFRLPAAQWGPVIGPVHPNCTEGPLQYWTAELAEGIEAVANRILGRA